MANKFNIEWEVEDGYAGGRRSQFCKVDDGILDDEMTDDELEELYNDIVMEEFMQNISANGSNSAEFVEWAQAAMKVIREEDDE